MSNNIPGSQLAEGGAKMKLSNLAMRVPALVGTLGLVLGCTPQTQAAGTTTKAESPMTAAAAASAPPAPMPQLAETPADKLGTAPAGFGLKVGDKAPDASLPDVMGKTQSLAEIFSQGPTLVLFYRGGWCPFCNLQLHDYSVKKPEFDKRGLRLVAISVDKPSEEAKMQAKHGVPFPMLSDSKLAAHQAYGVVHVPGDAEKKAMADYHIDLAAYSGESHGDFAVPAIFLVDRNDVVRFVHVDEDYKTRPSAKQMLSLADRLLFSK
jgi:peroxiredoxin